MIFINSFAIISWWCYSHSSYLSNEYLKYLGKYKKTKTVERLISVNTKMKIWVSKCLITSIKHRELLCKEMKTNLQIEDIYNYLIRETENCYCKNKTINFNINKKETSEEIKEVCN